MSNKKLRELVDAFFFDVRAGIVPLKNPVFQEELVKRIEAYVKQRDKDNGPG